MLISVLIGLILGGFLGVIIGGTWMLFAPLAGFERPPGETFL
jgi:hypothetical protein